MKFNHTTLSRDKAIKAASLCGQSTVKTRFIPTSLLNTSHNLLTMHSGATMSKSPFYVLKIFNFLTTFMWIILPMNNKSMLDTNFSRQLGAKNDTLPQKACRFMVVKSFFMYITKLKISHWRNSIEKPAVLLCLFNLDLLIESKTK